MARIRTIKPEYFRHELLQDLEAERSELKPMLVFAGLWGQCDKNGVFEYKPRQLKLDILPFLEFDMGASLVLLREAKLITLMLHGEKVYGYIPSFKEHQRINGKEAQDASKYPQPSEMAEQKQQGSGGEAPGKQQGRQEGKGREGEQEEEKEKPLLRVSDLAGMYQRYAGVNQCGSGVVPIFQAMIGKYTAEAIEEAFQAAAAANIETSKFLNWVRGRLERKKDAPTQVAKTEQGAGGYDPVTPQESKRLMEALRRARGDSPTEC